MARYMKGLPDQMGKEGLGQRRRPACCLWSRCRACLELARTDGAATLNNPELKARTRAILSDCRQLVPVRSQ
jgi:hypothetical protein